MFKQYRSMTDAEKLFNFSFTLKRKQHGIHVYSLFLYRNNLWIVDAYECSDGSLMKPIVHMPCDSLSMAVTVLSIEMCNDSFQNHDDITGVISCTDNSLNYSYCEWERTPHWRSEILGVIYIILGSLPPAFKGSSGARLCKAANIDVEDCRKQIMSGIDETRKILAKNDIAKSSVETQKCYQ